MRLPVSNLTADIDATDMDGIGLIDVKCDSFRFPGVLCRTEVGDTVIGIFVLFCIIIQIPEHELFHIIFSGVVCNM